MCTVCGTGNCEQDHGVLCSTSHHCCKEEEREKVVRAAFPGIASWLLCMSRLRMPSAPPSQQVSLPSRGLSCRKSHVEHVCSTNHFFFSCIVSPVAQQCVPGQSWWNSTSPPSTAALSPSGKRRTSPTTPGSRTCTRVFCKGRYVQRELEGLTFRSWSLTELSRKGSAATEQREGCPGSSRAG